MQIPLGIGCLLPNQLNNPTDLSCFSLEKLKKPKPLTYSSQPVIRKTLSYLKDINKSTPALKATSFSSKKQSIHDKNLEKSHEIQLEKIRKFSLKKSIYFSAPLFFTNSKESSSEKLVKTSQNPDKTSQNPDKPPEIHEKNTRNSIILEERFCKICFEVYETKLTGNLINPCKCTGTVRYIHEECLKTWQVSQKKDIKQAECELCHTKYTMSFKKGLKFYPRQAIEDGFLSFVSSICLFILIVTLISIIIIFALQL